MISQARFPAELGWCDALGIEQVPKHVGIGSGWDGMVAVLVAGRQIAQSVEVHFRGVKSSQSAVR